MYARDSIAAGLRWVRHAVRALTRKLAFLLAKLITTFRLEPDNPVIVGIVKLMRMPAAGPLRAFLPTFSTFILCPPASHGDPTTADQAVLAVAAIARFAGDVDREIEALEKHVNRYGPNVASPVFERLAKAQLGNNESAKATNTLRKGLSIHPRSGTMHRAMALALSNQSEWTAALEHWEKLPDVLQQSADVWTAIGIARAYRMTGSPLKAHSIASHVDGPDAENEMLQEELRLCRPQIIDWRDCLQSAEPVSASRKMGEVTAMGFLHGGSDPLTGWVDAATDGAREVGLLVNDQAMAKTVAAGDANGPDKLAFSINCTDLQQYLGNGDTVRLVTDGYSIPLAGLGNAGKFVCEEESLFTLLRERLKDGYVFTKDGRLRPGHNADTKRAVLDLYEEVSAVISKQTGQPVFPFYGNLLGAVREGDFIEHDVDGFDALYLCASNRPDEVKLEMADVCRLLTERNYDLRVEPFSIMIRRLFSDEVFIDLNYGWFTSRDELNLSFGWRFEAAVGRERFVAERYCQLAGREVRIPGNAEEVLQQVYGSGWRVPDQGFASRENLVRDGDYILTPQEIESIVNASDLTLHT